MDHTLVEVGLGVPLEPVPVMFLDPVGHRQNEGEHRRQRAPDQCHLGLLSGEPSRLASALDNPLAEESGRLQVDLEVVPQRGEVCIQCLVPQLVLIVQVDAVQHHEESLVPRGRDGQEEAAGALTLRQGSQELMPQLEASLVARLGLRCDGVSYQVRVHLVPLLRGENPRPGLGVVGQDRLGLGLGVAIGAVPIVVAAHRGGCRRCQPLGCRGGRGSRRRGDRDRGG
mmetsp:Transcript_27845/g.60008  ORF Transcript_27845/g.60008 Transcript_27845/m.60008 type:complete len:227 (-) Transcript_27845:640-1320(-)